MALRVNVIEHGDFDRAMRELGRRAPAVAARAQNRAIASGRTQLTRDVRTDLGLKAALVRDALSVRTANKSNPVAQLRATTRRIPLVAFGAKGPFPSRGRGAVRLRGKTYEHAFMAPARRGGLAVFTRDSGPRLPMFELKGPSVFQSAANHLGPAQARTEEVFRMRLVHELEHELRQVAGTK